MLSIPRQSPLSLMLPLVLTILLYSKRIPTPSPPRGALYATKSVVHILGSGVVCPCRGKKSGTLPLFCLNTILRQVWLKYCSHHHPSKYTTSGNSQLHLLVVGGHFCLKLLVDGCSCFPRLSGNDQGNGSSGTLLISPLAPRKSPCHQFGDNCCSCWLLLFRLQA